MATLSTLETRVAGSVNINLADSGEKALVDGWLNEAVEQFLELTGVRRTSALMALTTGVGDYEISTNILTIKGMLIQWQGQELPLQQVDEQEIEWRRRGTLTGNDYPSCYAIAGDNMLMVYPTPTSALNIVIYYVPKPASPMAAAGDDPSNVTFGGVPTKFHNVLEAYGKWKAAEWDDDTSSEQGLVFKKQWEEGIVTARVRLNRKSGPLAPARPKRSRGSLPRLPGTIGV
jgi:hypothetical protein